MQYHQAAMIGTKRAREAQYKLFSYSGFAYLTKTVKQGKDGFLPVGEEELVAMDILNDEAIVVICDSDGYAKAQTKPLSIDKAKEILEKMIKDGFNEYKGKIEAVK
ncbi:MAG: hypothetical protein KatS3mg003_1831 [Candidatus Nitrosocaldaceae archaeon]|nr:MAG: hypothetical protein KatS3mg003_1831 [Candidatus Nitrosocaldaceae archaeon]